MKVNNEFIKTVRDLPFVPLFVLLSFGFLGVLGNHLAPYDPNQPSYDHILTPPFFQSGGTLNHILGTDESGRDVLSRLVCGTSVSLQVGFIVVIIAGFIGCVVALLGGYLGGWSDVILMRITDITLSMPYIMIAIVLAAVLGPSKQNIIIVLSIIGWGGYARVLRGEVMRVRVKDFVSLAIVAGCSKTRIMLKHIFPNIMNTFVVLATLQLGTVIISEAALSFLGLGVRPPDPSWGTMIAEGRSYIEEAWWLSTFPGMSIVLVVLSSNMLGDWLRVRLDPKFRQL